MEQWKRNLWILWVAQFILMCSMSLVIPFLPLYIEEMGVNNPELVSRWSGLIFGANFLTAFLISPFWGTLADRYGRKVMLLRSALGMSFTVSLMGFAQTPVQLLLLRLVNGLISGFGPASIALVAANTPKKQSAYAMGVIQSGAVAGTIMGPFLGGLLTEWMPFRHIFFVTGGLLILVALMVIFFVKENFQSAPAEKKTKLRGSFAGIISYQPLPSLLSLGMLIQFALMSVQPLLPLFVQELHPGSSHIAFWAGLVPAVTGLATATFSPLLGRLGDKKGIQYVLFYSSLATTVFLIPQALVNSIWGLLIARFFVGMAIGGLIPSINALIFHFAPKGLESTTFGYSSSALFLGNMLGPIIGGFSAGWIGIRGVFLMSAVLFALNTLWMKYVFQHYVDEKWRLYPKNKKSKVIKIPKEQDNET